MSCWKSLANLVGSRAMSLRSAIYQRSSSVGIGLVDTAQSSAVGWISSQEVSRAMG